jgi:hypothetical protein
VPQILLPAPYIVPEILTNAATGISWDTLPSRNSTPAQKYAEQWNICRRATAMIDVEVNQRLRATISTETLLAPDFRVTIVAATQTAYILLARQPILEVTAGQVAFNSPPLQYVTIPANQFVVNQPAPGVGGSFSTGDAGESGQSVTLAPGWVSWWGGRKSQFLQVTYVSGYPHATLTADAAAGATMLTIDDTTGWAPVTTGNPGAQGIIYDAGNEETVNCTTTSVASGPGTITLTAATTFEHAAGTVISSLPPQLMQAAILFGVSQALVRGATATGIESITAGQVHGDSPEAFAAEAELLCKPYRRVH